MPFLYALASALASYKIFSIFTHPNSKLWQRWPRLKFKRIDVFPSLRITIKGRVIHFHHWFNFSLLLCTSIFVSGGILDSWITRGALLGGIVQGLSIPSARKIIYR
jgi:hypothetical protein